MIDFPANEPALELEDPVMEVEEDPKEDLNMYIDENEEEKLVPSCCVIFDLEPLSLSFDFVFDFEISKSFPYLS
nr:hypothetical protein [Tanacetum cinerariifolium]